MLKVGMDADLVVLSQDIFAVPGGQIGRTHALMTLVGGEVVYDAAARNETEPRELRAAAGRAVVPF